jgi:hypothetical protein
MKFSLEKLLVILENTPAVISTLLDSLDDEWIMAKESENTWTVKDVVAHLIVCEQTNWIPRAQIILSEEQERVLTTVDMNVHFEMAQGNTLENLIELFKNSRKSSLNTLKGFNLQDKDFDKIAIHPKIGEVTLKQLISTWATHDLTHLTQITRIMAKQNKENVGAFESFLNILKS